MSSKPKYDIFPHRSCRVFCLLVVVLSQSLIPRSRRKVESCALHAHQRWCLCIRTLHGDQSESLRSLRSPWADSRLRGHREQKTSHPFLLLSSCHWLLENCGRDTPRELTSFESFYRCYILYCFLDLQER